MKRYHVAALSACAFGLLAAGALHADSMSLGEYEYQNSCIACHGSDGKGGGPVAKYLTEALPDLSMLQQTNGGVFPVQRVYEVIEGTLDVRAHGSRDMPVWGNSYRARIDPARDEDFGPAETDAYVRTRILALIEYLSTLQAE